MNPYLSGILRELMPCLFGNFISDSFFGNYALIDLSRNDEQTGLLDMFYHIHLFRWKKREKTKHCTHFSGKCLKIITHLLLLWIFPQWVPFHCPRRKNCVMLKHVQVFWGFMAYVFLCKKQTSSWYIFEIGGVHGDTQRTHIYIYIYIYIIYIYIYTVCIYIYINKYWNISQTLYNLYIPTYHTIIGRVTSDDFTDFSLHHSAWPMPSAVEILLNMAAKG